MSNSTNRFYSPKDELNYEVYETKYNEKYIPNNLHNNTTNLSLTEINNLINSKEGYSIFKYEPPKADESGFIKLPQVPYEVKERAMKGFLYTFFLTFLGRVFGAFKYNIGNSFFPYVPAAVFLYQYSHTLWTMINTVSEIRLIDGGKTVRLYFKQLRNPVEVPISNLIKKKEENFFNECFTEPFLYPIQINRTDKYGKYSLRSHWTVYLYGDSHDCIKNGEILRSIINNQPIHIENSEGNVLER